MKNKIITLVIVIAVLLTPSVVALTSYIYAQNNPITTSSVSKMVLSIPNREVMTFSKSNNDDNSALTAFISMIDDADKVKSMLSSPEYYTQYKVSYYCYNKQLDYTYYLSNVPSDNYFRDSKGQLFHISEKNAKSFLKTKYATDLFPEASQPTLNIGSSDNVLPSESVWKYVGIEDKYVDGAVHTTASKPICNVSGGLQLEFSVQPDYLYAQITNTEGEVVFDDLYDEIDPSLFSDNTVYDVILNAKWYQSQSRKNYGETTYKFTANVLSPAVFYLKTYEKLTYGDFVVVSAKNIVDPSLIKFSSTPSIDYKPTFFEYGGYYHALIPISIACEKRNSGELNYSFTFEYGETSQSIPVTLVKRGTGKDYQNISASTIHSLRNDTTIKEFNDTVMPYLTAKENNIFWMTDGVLSAPTTRKIRTGFGIDVILSNTGTTYQHEGVNYYVKDGDKVKSCLSGKVVYVGETTLSGKTVIIEHGGGLKSLYAHLSAVYVELGQDITKGNVVGIVGNTGFCTGTTLHFGLYVNDVPVRYYKYDENDGVSVSDLVAKAIGIK